MTGQSDGAEHGQGTSQKDSCTFCDGDVSMAIHVVDGTESRRYELPVCDDHWRDYLRGIEA